MEKEIDYKSLVIMGGDWRDTSDTQVVSGQYMDGTEIEDEELERLTNELDLSQILFERM